MEEPSVPKRKMLKSDNLIIYLPFDERDFIERYSKYFTNMFNS